MICEVGVGFEPLLFFCVAEVDAGEVEECGDEKYDEDGGEFCPPWVKVFSD